MPILSKSRRLRKELSLLDVYAIATGTTLSSGFFVLPGLAAQEAGPALVLSYLIAAVPMVPAMFCAVELATAMPRAGGAYYFLDRSLGPLVGTIGGIGTWLALVLKSAFALVGMGAYLQLFFPEAPMIPVAAAFALLFGLLNLLGARRTGRAQLFLVVGLMIILFWFLVHGSTQIETRHFAGFFDAGFDKIFSTAGLVYISYVGITKVASISEEVKDPERNLPLGVFMALGTAVVIYSLGTVIMVGIIPARELAGNLTPAALVADHIGGRYAVVLICAAAILAFSSVANAGILSSSRYPLAMSRDHLLPGYFSDLGKSGVPATSIRFTVASILAFLLLFDPGQIAKLASAFQLVVFAMLALAVIVMRESHIDSYDPGYRLPAYPWVPIFGIVAPLWLVYQMGRVPMLFAIGLIGVGVAWYIYYVRGRVARTGAMYHVFERLGRYRFEGLDRELRGILKEKGLREADPFDETIARAFVLDLKEPTAFEEIVEKASELLARRLPVSAQLLAEGFLKGTRIGATPVAGGAALPHLRLWDITHPEVVLVRCQHGVEIDAGDVFGATHGSERIYALFFLVGPERDPAQHLRLLAQIAGQLDQEHFLAGWMNARDEHDLVEVMLRDDRYLALRIATVGPTAPLSGRALREIKFPESCLVALIRRRTETVVPRGSTVLAEGDQLIILGSREGIEKLRREYAKPG